jgi:hypothetical protein
MDGFARQGPSSGHLSVECLEDRFLLAGGLLPAHPLPSPLPGTAARVSSTTPYQGRTEAEPAAAPLRPAQPLALAGTGTAKANTAPAHDRATAGPLPADARAPDQDDGDKGAEYRDRLEHDSSPNWAILGGNQALNGAKGGQAGAAGAVGAPAPPAVPVPPVALEGREQPAQELTRPVDRAVAQAPLPTAVPAVLVAGSVPADACGEQDGAAPLPEPAAPGAAPPAGTPLAGALPFDLGALERGVDRFFARLADLRDEWDGAWAPARLLPWLTAATAAALVIARRHKPPASSRAAAGCPAAALFLPRGQP